MKKTVSRQKGFTLYVLLALVSILYLSFFAYNNSVMNALTKVHYTLTIEEVRKISISLVNSIYSYITLKCKSEPASPIAKFVATGKTSEFEIDVKSDPVLQGIFDVFKPAVIEKISLRTQSGGGQPERPRPDQPDGSFVDPFEKTVIIEISCLVSINGLKYECRVKRIFAKLLATVPIYSKFSLMIRNRNHKKMIYNLFINTLMGLPEKFNKLLPTVVINHNSEEDPESGTILTGRKTYLERGHIYFGSETILNKTSGVSKEYSELFHFASFDVKEIGILKFYSSSEGVPFKPPNPPGGYMVEYVPLGYYSTMFADPTAPFVLKKYHGMNPFSSTLHLYGNMDNPSPTVVIGRVYQSYPIYKSITNDLNKNKIIDNVPIEYVIVNALKNCPDFFNLLELSKFPANFIVATSKIHKSWGEICDGLYENYAKIMTVIVKEPYNKTYNYMLYMGFLAREAKSAVNVIDEADLNNFMDPTKYKISVNNFDGTETSVFSGDPGEADVTKILKARVQKDYKNQAELFKDCLAENTFSMRSCVVRVLDGPVAFPENMKIGEGGIIFLEKGDFDVNGVAGGPDGRILSLYAAKGSINIDASKKHKYLSLNAPEGFVRNSSSSPAPLDLTGNVVCRNFDHLSFRGGGTIQYSLYLDPSNAKFMAARYKYSVLPNVLSFSFSRK